MNEEEIEVFLDTLDWPELAMHILAAQPTTLSEAVRTAKLHQGFRDRTRANQGRISLRQLGPEEEQETSATITSGEQLLHDAIRQLSQEVAHIKLQASQPKSDPIACYICEGEHYASGCPQRGTRNGKPRQGRRSERNYKDKESRKQKSGN